MVTFIKITKEGNISEEKVDSIDNLYKKCGLRKSEGFSNIYECETSKGRLELWSRTSGRVNMKSSYIFPLKKDLLIYGTSGLVLKDKDYIDFTISILDEVVKTNQESNGEDVIKESDNDSDEESSDEDSESGDSSELDSELQLEDYIYSSEEDQ